MNVSMNKSIYSLVQRMKIRRFYVLFWGSVVTFILLLLYEFNYGFLCAEKAASQYFLDEIRRKNTQIRDLSTKLKEFERNRISSNCENGLNSFKEDKSEEPWIFIITPTYARATQKAELTRLSHTFLHVPKLHWIVIEDAKERTTLVHKFLEKSRLCFTQMNIQTPSNYKMKHTDPNWLKPRGVLQRNEGLRWIRENVNQRKNKGVVYFADDDNTYSLQIFEEMRNTKKASVWPVGLVGKLRYESPVVEAGKVVGWHTYWKPNRPFALDMAGFAVNVNLVLENPTANFMLEVERGYLESSFLDGLVKMKDLEPKANNCKEVLVWHTRTEKADMRNEEKLLRIGKTSNPNMEV